jgi:hypothetical protein
MLSSSQHNFSLLINGIAVDWIALTLQDINDQNYLKIQGSSPLISRLICGCTLKSHSFSNSAAFNELKQKRNHKLMSNVQKKLKTEQVVEITIGSTNVSILCPGKRSASADLLVLMDQDQLSCVFDFLKTDCKPQKDEEAD